jgi:hypothetical protein
MVMVIAVYGGGGGIVVAAVSRCGRGCGMVVVVSNDK